MIEIFHITSSWQASDHTTIVALEDGKVVGSCIVDYNGSNHKDAYLWNLWVVPEKRELRIAGKLISYAEQDARSRRCKDLSLGWLAIDTDGWVLDWYKRIGFKVTGYRHSDNATILTKQLKIK